MDLTGLGDRALQRGRLSVSAGYDGCKPRPVTTLLPLDGGASRIFDAVIGGGVALVAATLVPGAPLRRPREQAAKVTAELARLLRSAAISAEHADVDHA